MRYIGNVEKDGQVRAVASGALSNGDTVIVNSDGTVSAVAESAAATGTPVVFDSVNIRYSSAAFDSSNNKIVVVYCENNSPQYGYAVVGTVSGTSISFGTPVVFHSGQTTESFVVFDSNANKMVVTYRDNGDSNYGKAIVGTVSGTSISFGSETTYNSAEVSYPKSAFDSNSNKVVVTYRDNGNSDYGTAIVGTVSGTSISFGSEVVFDSQRVDYVFPTFDSTNNKIVVAYRIFGGSRPGYAIVGTVSGTSISFGSSTQFESGQTNYITSTFDSSNGKVVMAYRDDNNSDQGTAAVGTVSGTSISFGTPVVFNASSVADISAVFDSSNGKVFIGYTDNGNSQHGTIIIGTVSGTSISFDNETVLEDSASYNTSLTFDSTSNVVVSAYRNTGNSGYGTAAVYKAASTNLTAENFIGFADSGYADTQSAAINTTCSVDRNQTGLTAGQKYYVQTDGSLGLTAADPSVEAGTAISSTEILVKG